MLHLKTAASRIPLSLLAGLLLAGAGAPSARAEVPGAALQARYVSLQARLADNDFKRPLHLDSTESSDRLQGDLFVVLDHPFATVRQALPVIANWCDILILHLNVKGSRVLPGPGPGTLLVNIGRKNDEPLDETHPVNFGYRVAAADDRYLHVLLHAATGPMGTKDYEIALEAVPLPGGRSFIHLAYSYEYGFAARLAMKAYLATLGSDKVGFSVTGRTPAGKAELVDGVRGVVERNTMRYYLAVEAFLGALSVPPADRPEKRLRDWFAATERFPRQLHELGEEEYLAMKRKEMVRQQAPLAPAG